MKFIKKWIKKHKLLLSGITAIQGVIGLLMDIINNETLIYLMIVFPATILFIGYLTDRPNCEFLLADGKAQFVRIREPLFLSDDLISFLPDETKKEARDKKWSYKKLLKKVKKYWKNS